MGSSQTTTQNQTATQTADPRMQAAVAPILSASTNILNTPYNSGMDPRVAALTPMQQEAIQGLGGLQTNNPASPYINQANQYSQLAANPQNVVNMAQQFYNPMSQQVLNQLGNVFGQQNAQLLGNAASSGSIGGSRYGVAAGNLANQQGLAAGQTLAGLQQQALNAAQTQQGQISQQAFTQGQLGQEALNTQIQGINAALQAGTITQQQAQQQLNALQQGAIQQTLFPQQEAAAAANIAGLGTTLGGTSVGQSQTQTPINYLGQILGGLTAGAGLLASDERVKENIHPIGKTYDSQVLYRYNYIGDPTTRIGLMAQEVQKKHPSAVESINGTKAVDYGKATAKSAEIGEHRLRRDVGGDVHVPETHFPTLNLNPPQQQQSGSKGSGGLPVRQHRAIGGGTGVGLGDQGVAALGGMPSPSSSGLNYNGIQSPLAPYFAQSPQVHVPQTNLPQLSLGQQGGNQAQLQQQDQTAKQWSDFGSALKQNNVLGNADQALFADFGGGGADFARGGRIHRQDGGLLSLSPEDKQNLDYLRGGAPSWLGGDTGNTPPPSAQPIGPSTLERFLNERRSAALRATPQDYGVQPQSAPPQPLLQNTSLAPGSAPEKLASAPTMGDLSPTPGPGQYIVRDYDGRPIGTPQTAAPDPALVQRAPIQQAAIASPAQAPAPIAAPQQQPVDRVSLGLNTQMPPLALDVIKSNEGFAPTAQWDYKQYSGGYGTRAQPGQTYTPESAQKELLEQTAPLHDFISQNVHVPLTQKQYAGLADFGHNLGVGPGGLTDLLPDINRGDWARVAQRMQHYNQAGGQVLDDLVRRRAMDGALVQNQDVAVNPPAISGGGRRSVLDRPDLQPPKSEDTNLAKYLKTFNLDPEGKRKDWSDFLFKTGLRMMATPPTVGVKGFPGAAISALTAAGEGGQYALQQEQQERAQAINMANAAMNQKLHEAQMQHYAYESKKPFKIGTEIVTDSYGRPYPRDKMGVPDPNSPTGYREIPSSQTGPTSTTAINPPETIEELQKTVPANVWNEANAIADYDRAPYNARNSQPGSPGATVMQTAREIARLRGEEYDEGTYGAKKQAIKVLTSGIDSRALANGNTGIGHFYDIVQSVDKMDPGQYPSLNQFKNWLRTQAGKDATKSYNSNAGLLAEELVSFYRGIGGAEADIQRELKNLDPNLSLEQQRGVIGKMATMIRDKLNAMETKRNFAFGKDAEKKLPLLNNQAKEELGAIEEWANRNPEDRAHIRDVQKGGSSHPVQNVPQQNAPQQAVQAGKPVSVSSVEEAMRLPSGTHFITPDGREKVRP